MLTKQLHWVLEHALKTAVGVVVAGALGLIAANYRVLFSNERTVNLAGEILSMEVPQFWLENPKRGSIDFSDNSEILKTGIIKAGLSVRTDDGDSENSNRVWRSRDPWKVVANLRNGEHLCDITNALETETLVEGEIPDHYYVGFQTHCVALDACSIDIEGTTLRVTIIDVDLIIRRKCAQP